jgi:hypothetical protein
VSSGLVMAWPTLGGNAMTRWLFDILGSVGEQIALFKQPTRPRWSRAHRHSTPRRPVPAWTPPAIGGWSLHDHGTARLGTRNGHPVGRLARRFGWIPEAYPRSGQPVPDCPGIGRFRRLSLVQSHQRHKADLTAPSCSGVALHFRMMSQFMDMASSRGQVPEAPFGRACSPSP